MTHLSRPANRDAERRGRKAAFQSVDAERTPTTPVVDDREAANPTANHTTPGAGGVETEYDPPAT